MMLLLQKNETRKKKEKKNLILTQGNPMLNDKFSQLESENVQTWTKNLRKTPVSM